MFQYTGVAYMYIGVVIGVIVGITLLSHIPFYFVMRRRTRHMRSLAQEFRLSFTDASPHFFTMLFLYFFRNLRMNRIEGLVAGHRISIYDWYHFNLLQIYKYYQRETFVEIDGKTAKEGYTNFSLSRPSLTSVEELHNILNGLKQSRDILEE